MEMWCSEYLENFRNSGLLCTNSIKEDALWLVGHFYRTLLIITACMKSGIPVRCTAENAKIVSRILFSYVTFETLLLYFFL